MTQYCEPADLYDFGLPRGVLPNPGRLVSVVYPTTDLLELDGHGFRLNAQLLFRAEDGGSMPAPLVSGTTYYAIPVTDSTFQVAASSGGAAINLTTTGESVVVSTPLSTSRAIEFVSALIDEMLPAHVVPITSTIPTIVRATCAQLAAQYMLQATGGKSEQWNLLVAEARKLLERWARGVPIRGENAPAPANLSVVGSATPSRPWSVAGGTIP